jgi:O-antigen ligase
MQTRIWGLTAAALLGFASGGTALAIQPAGANLSSDAISGAGASSTRVERGGTVGAVDWRKRTLVVDDVTYAISASPVTVHGPDGQRSAKTVDLKPGMQIRFSTSRQNFSANDQVVEIWVTEARAKAVGK